MYFMRLILVLFQVLVKSNSGVSEIFVYLYKYRGAEMDNLYETISRLCRDRNIRPGRLCDELNLSRGLMTDLKMGRKKSVSAETAQKIASYFGVSVGYLLGKEDSVSRAEKRDVLDEIDISFYGAFKELSEEQKDTIRAMVRVMRDRQAAKQRDESV